MQLLGFLDTLVRADGNLKQYKQSLMEARLEQERLAAIKPPETFDDFRPLLGGAASDRERTRDALLSEKILY